VRKQTDLLDDIAHASAQFHWIASGDVFAVQEDAAAGWLDESVNHLHGGGLAASGWANEYDE